MHGKFFIKDIILVGKIMSDDYPEITYLNKLDDCINQGKLMSIALPAGWHIFKNYLVDVKLSYFRYLYPNDDIFWIEKKYPCHIQMLIYGNAIIENDEVIDLQLTMLIDFSEINTSKNQKNKNIARFEFQFIGYRHVIGLIECVTLYIHQYLYEDINSFACQKLYHHVCEFGKDFIVESDESYI